MPAYLLDMRVLRAMALLAITAACAPLNAGPRLAAYHLLVPGQSTAQDAAALLGRPVSVTQISPTAALIQWMAAGGSQHVAISFGQDGRMIGVQHIFGL